MLLCSHCLPIAPLRRTLAPLIRSTWSCVVIPHRGLGGSRRRNTEIGFGSRNGRKGGRVRIFCGKDEYYTGNNVPVAGFVKKREIVEHILLLAAKVDISDADEKDMLDFLYTTQYYMRGIVAVSLGRVEGPNVENVTHAVYMRFQRKEDLARFSGSPHIFEVLKQHVLPYCYGMLSVDYVSEVEDDMLSIFRRGEDFNHGVEFILLMSLCEAFLGHAIEDAVLALRNLLEEFDSLIVQGTIGSNFSNGNGDYTHAAVIRFHSYEAFEMFRTSSKYKEMWNSKFQPITKKVLLLHFNVDPMENQLL
ncbi:hypothetical protein HPP92_004974 [Vanilla planifolia]|uniref:Stress-response A/B barrel domain-containing protein n=1 Tax=Vanilla planifolia TaxID=51239 RepID=A0A835VCS2_VANPL|nr:hypothetical protein HPP92_004974 [Vanilla planifolia]